MSSSSTRAREKIQVFKKLAVFCERHKQKNDTELTELLNKSFAPTTFYYIYGSKALCGINIEDSENEISNQRISNQAQEHLKIKNEENSRSKDKKAKVESAKDFLR